MLPIVLILFLASSAFANISLAKVDVYNVDEIPPVPDNGLAKNFDGGETSVYMQNEYQIIKDLGKRPDKNSQTLAISQAFALFGELAYGIPGDACASANLINAYVSGNKAALRNALDIYVLNLVSKIDAIAQLARDPNSLKYTTGIRGNCAGGGRIYRFEAAWDAIRSSVSPLQADLINEEYCATKRLYNAFYVQNNNIGAAITASSLPPTLKVTKFASDALHNLLRAIAYKGNVRAAAAVAKAQLLQAASNIKL
ncbi:unnamed protein product [Parnassius apollo]|uniref:(apollo) hypothetical protein n=1 Tax=Parnassius apollo TaxID=110799 RepID=A0A8S3W351_PARAO|nr:unnamed protein product [Parnassius apollo]